MATSSEFYVYAYLREDGSPYYIGKGKGARAFSKGRGEVRPPEDKTRIVILAENLEEKDAFTHEIELIAEYGRKDIGTGVLRNKTNGGDGPSGRKFSEESCKLISTNRKGKGKGPQTKERIEKRAEKLRGKKHTPEHIEAAAAPKRGKKHTKERCNNISAALKGNVPWNKGKTVGPRSEESILKQKLNAKGINSGPQPTVSCPHCGKIGGKSNMKRYHFVNCKLKGIS